MKRKNENQHLWDKEFGADYSVPSEICDNPLLEDISWHNDLCPSFCLANAEGTENLARIWVNHVNPEMREDKNHARFIVLNDDDFDSDSAFETENAQEAINNLLSR